MRSWPKIARQDWLVPRDKQGRADTLEAVLAGVAAALAEGGYDEPRRRARQLISGSLGISAAELLMYPQRRVGRAEIERLQGNVRRIMRREPLSRVLGWREFWGLKFALTADTLDPRPESETIVETVLARIGDSETPLELLDLGTGTGCLLLALLSELPTSSGIGVDLSQRAAATARRNADILGLSRRAQFVVGDWGGALARRFDVIVANPPYIPTGSLAELPPEVARYDPRRALDGGPDGLVAYRTIAAQIAALLEHCGLIVVEVGAAQAHLVAQMFEQCGLYVDAIERDLAGIERCVAARRAARGEAGSGQKSLGM